MGWKWGISGGSRNCFAVEMGHWGQVPPHRRHERPERPWAGRRARGWREGGGAELRQISANQRRGRGSAPAARSWGTPWVAVSRARGPARPVRRVPGVGGKGVPTPEEGRGREAAPLGGEIRAGEGARRGTTRQKPREKKEEEEGAGRRKPRAARLSLTATKWRAGGDCPVGESAGWGAAAPWGAAASLGPCSIPSRDPGSDRCLALWQQVICVNRGWGRKSRFHTRHYKPRSPSATPQVFPGFEGVPTQHLSFLLSPLPSKYHMTA